MPDPASSTSEQAPLSDGVALLLATSDGRREPARQASPVGVLLFVLVAGAAALVAGLLLLDEPRTAPAGPPAALVRAAPSLVPVPFPARTAPPAAVRSPDPSPSVFVVVSPPPLRPPPVPAAAATQLPLVLTPSTGGNGAELLVLGSGWTPGATVGLDYLGVDGASTGSTATVVVDPGGGFGVELLAEDPSDLTGRHIVRATEGTRVQDVPYDVE
ncbi:MAG: hypothetical protein JWN88_2151 [Frankiales bacterium]|nr:hypothetical protein [Frankiales bacterium]